MGLTGETLGKKSCPLRTPPPAKPLKPCVNRLQSFGRWAFVELKEVYKIEGEFETKVEADFGMMINEAVRSGI